MKIQELRKIKKLYFSYEDIAKALGISQSSAKVSANRYVRHGFLVRVKRNIYILKEKWNSAGIDDKFVIANLAQVPSYISLMTALAYHGITTQVQRDLFESIAVKRTKEINIDMTVFHYTKINKNLYFGFIKQKEFFIATPEKAFLDAIYLKSFGRYDLDIASVDFDKLDVTKLDRMSIKFPKKTQRLLVDNGYLERT